MTWKYWDRRGDWEAPRAYVLERAGAIVAHVGLWPVTFDSGAVRGVQMIDWASTREASGAGLALLRKLDSMFDFVYSIGGSDMTRKILPAVGFVEHTSQWKAARPLRPFRQIATHQHRNWKLAPRLARNFLWRSPATGPEGFTCHKIRPEQLRETNPQNVSEAVFCPRPPAFFEYLQRCPVMPVHLYGIQSPQGHIGHFALGVLRGQARVAGVWLEHPYRKSARAAFALAQQAAARLKDANEVVIAGSAGSSEQAAAQSGLRTMVRSPVYLLNRKRLPLRDDFQFQLCDDDAFFLDSGNPSYLT